MAARRSPSTKQVTAKVEAPAEKKLSAKERLAAKARQKQDAPGVPKDDRDVIMVTDQHIAMVIERMTAAAHAEKSIKGHKEAARSIVFPYAKRIEYMEWVKAGNRKENPVFQTPSGCKFIFQCKDTICGKRGFRAPKKENGELVPMKTHLENHGVPAELITLLGKQEEFSEETVLTLDMPKIEKNNPSLAERILDLLMEANENGVSTKDGKLVKFSDEEMEMMLEKNNDVTIKKGFLDRIVGYCKASTKNDEAAAKALERILTAIEPTWATSSLFCTDPETMIVNLIHEAPAKPKSDVKAEHDCGKYTVQQEGLMLTIIRKSDGKKMATKECSDEKHVTNTVRKWNAEPANLDSYIADNA